MERSLTLRIARLSAAGLVLGTFSAAGVGAQTPEADFRSNCASCHTVGGGQLVGPDLRGVTERKDRAWLTRFIVDPKRVIDSGDPYALALRDAARGVVMPALPGMTPDRATSLLDLIERESGLETSQFSGAAVDDKPFTPADVALGRELYLGLTRLAKGGPPCVSCHSVNGLGVLAGGKLGPDLNAVFERLNGRKGLSSWLLAPATPTMQSVFKNHPIQPDEIVPLVAFFADKSVAPPESGQAATLIFILSGLAGTAAMLVIFDVAWRRRFRSVREALVRAANAGGRG